jgi:hypothetical protein
MDYNSLVIAGIFVVLIIIFGPKICKKAKNQSSNGPEFIPPESNEHSSQHPARKKRG